MAAMRLTRFVDPAFLEQINEDEQFRKLLAPWRQFFKANGLPLAKLIADPSRGGGAVDCVTTPDVLFGGDNDSPNRIPGIKIEVLSGSSARVIRDGEVGEIVEAIAISSLRDRRRVGQDWIVKLANSHMKNRLEDTLNLPTLFLPLSQLKKSNPARAKLIRDAIGCGNLYVARAEIYGVGPQ